MMRRLATVIAVALASVACGEATADTGTPSEAEIIGDEGSKSPTRAPDDPVKTTPAEDDPRHARALRSRAPLNAEGNPSAIVSSVEGDYGELYVTGLFRGTMSFGGAKLMSHGGDDVWVARIDADGSVPWTRTVGSATSERAPHLSYEEGRVRLVATTFGEVDCGDGPLVTWTTQMFFMCVYDPADGTVLAGGSFPIAP